VKIYEIERKGKIKAKYIYHPVFPADCENFDFSNQLNQESKSKIKAIVDGVFLAV
jgi:hypothetical protein